MRVQFHDRRQLGKKLIRLTATTPHPSSAAILRRAEPLKSRECNGNHAGRNADDRKLLAPLWHTALLVLFVVSYSLLQVHFSARTETLQLRSRVPVYLFAIFFELILWAYVWFLGVRRSGTRFADVVGGRWARAADVWRDIGVAFVFWLVVIVFLIIVGHALGENPHAKKALQVLMPRGALEMFLWVLLSISAGFCEEFIFRGYLQKQFFAITGNNAAAIAAQALVFGVAHGYQGVKGMASITIYGALFGILAIARKSLRPGMIQLHAGRVRRHRLEPAGKVPPRSVRSIFLK